MIIGVGIDIVEIKRIKQVMTRQPRFAKRILTDNEYRRYIDLHNQRQVEFLAGRFAAKEAFMKAVGTGVSKEFTWQDVEIVNNERGKPIMEGSIEETIHLSISHSKDYAVAQVIIESLSS